MTKTLLLIFFIAAAAMAACDSESQPTPSASEETPLPAALETVPAADAAPEQTGEEIAETDEIEVPVVAMVNGTPISKQTLEGQMVMAESGRLSLGEDASRNAEERRAATLELRLEILSNLINLELACQEAIARGYAPTETELNKALQEFMRGFGDDSPEQIYKILDQFGQTEDDLKSQLAKNMALQKWQENDFLGQIKVTDEEARAFYDAHPNLVQHGDLIRVSQVFVAVPLGSLENAKDQARAKADQALSRLHAGDDFGAVAAEMSSDPAVAKTKGDLGWLGKGQYPPIFEETLSGLKPGQISAVVESPMGFHIFKVTGAKPAGQEPFESIKVDIVDFLSSGKLAEAVRQKMIDLRREADIQILDPKLKKAYESYEAAEAAAMAVTQGSAPAAGQSVDAE